MSLGIDEGDLKRIEAFVDGDSSYPSALCGAGDTIAVDSHEHAGPETRALATHLREQLDVDEVLFAHARDLGREMDRTAVGIGHSLSVLADHGADGLVVSRRGQTANGATRWRIERVPGGESA